MENKAPTAALSAAEREKNDALVKAISKKWDKAKDAESRAKAESELTALCEQSGPEEGERLVALAARCVKSRRGKKKLLNVVKGILFYYVLPLFLIFGFTDTVKEILIADPGLTVYITLGYALFAPLNWLVYSLIHRSRPSFPGLIFGSFTVFLACAVLRDGLDALYWEHPAVMPLQIIGVISMFNALAFLVYTIVRNRRKSLLVFRIVLGIVIVPVFSGSVMQILRDVSRRQVTGETYAAIGIVGGITLVLLLLLIIGSVFVAVKRHKATAEAVGTVTAIEYVGANGAVRIENGKTESEKRDQSAAWSLSSRRRARPIP